MKRLSLISPPPRSTRAITVVSLLLALTLLALTLPSHAQTADTLGQIHKIYLDTTGAKPDAAGMRKYLVNSLRKDHSLEVVAEPVHADAILAVSSEIWVKAYLSVNPRSPGTKFPVYGGFLSAQLLGKDGDTLWSYLVTPSRYAPGGIHQDLSDQMTKKLIEALHQAAPATPASRPAKGVTLKAAGATFPAPLYQSWIASFREHHPDIHITYTAISSEAGIQQLHDQKINFAASDVALSDLYMSQMPVKLLQFATVVGAVVPVYHLPQSGEDLRFTPEILVGIYLGKIRRWNDPSIRAINHSVNLPDAEIIVIHRADGSGTTFAWTDFLSKTSSEWKSAVGSGTTVKWPIGQGAQGNDGIASMVDRTPNSIGYVELNFAIQRKLSYGAVRNAAGNFILANLITLAAAIDNSSTHSAGNLPSSLINAPGKDSYPITSFTWLLVPESIPDTAIKSAIVEFIEWILTSGQKDCSALAYNPLPKEIVSRELQKLSTFKAK